MLCEIQLQSITSHLQCIVKGDPELYTFQKVIFTLLDLKNMENFIDSSRSRNCLRLTLNWTILICGIPLLLSVDNVVETDVRYGSLPLSKRGRGMGLPLLWRWGRQITIIIYILCQSNFKILMKNPERAQSIVENWEVKQGVEEGEPLEQCHRSYLLLPVFYHLSTQRYFGLRQICCGKKKLFKVNFQSLSTTFTFKIIFAFRIVLVGDASTYPIH